jgi:hypothetical protein
MFKDAVSLKDVHEEHASHASPLGFRFSQLMVFARILAQVVFPTPRGPQKRNACANWLFLMAFFNVLVMEL